MMTQILSKLAIEISEWPIRKHLEEFLHTSRAKDEIRSFLTQEFDTNISFRAGDIDLLDGYPEAFILPLHAFVASLSRGMKTLQHDLHADIPIYLQQYAISEGAPAHVLHLALQGAQIVLRFAWGGRIEAYPPHLKAISELHLDARAFQEEVINFINTYTRKITMLLGSLPDWQGQEISSLFDDF